MIDRAQTPALGQFADVGPHGAFGRSSRTSAISRGLPIAVPCRVKGGRSGSAGGEDLAIDAAAGRRGGAGERRDAEKSGRSRVAESEVEGIGTGMR